MNGVKTLFLGYNLCFSINEHHGITIISSAKLFSTNLFAKQVFWDNFTAEHNKKSGHPDLES